MNKNRSYASSGVALRLVLSYRQNAPPGQEVTLEEVERVEMLVEASDELPEVGPEGQLSGFWYELQTPEGEVLYRKITANPIRTWIDLPDEEDPTRITRYETLPEENIFTLLVPYFSEGSVVVLHSSPLEQMDTAGPAEPLWRIELPAREEGT
jgi:hypothetical protein